MINMLSAATQRASTAVDFAIATLLILIIIGMFVYGIWGPVDKDDDCL